MKSTTKQRKAKSEHRSFADRLKQHPFIVPVTTFIGLCIVTAIVLVATHSTTLTPSDARTVIVSHDKIQQTLPTRAATVGEFLERIDVKINEGDVVEPSLDTSIVEDNFRVNVYRALPVLVIDDGHQKLVYSAATTPRSIAAQAGVTVYPEDDLETKPITDFVKDNAIGSKVVIDRAVPTNINLYGTPVAVRTHADTVGELLEEKNIKLDQSDTVQPAADTVLTPNTQVFVVRQGSQVVTVDEAIAQTTRTVEDSSLSFGATAVRQEGSPGKRVVTYQITLQNGVEISRTKIQEVIAAQPVEKIIARGGAVNIPADKSTIMAAAGIASSDYAYVNFIISHESGWCPTKWQGQIGYCPAYYQEKYAGAETAAGLGYGLCQSTPAAKMQSAGADWRTNAVTQLKWCSGYAIGRYKSWAAAYDFWIAHRWW